MKNLLLKLGLLTVCLLAVINLQAQNQPLKRFTKADTLRGTLTKERTWWDVQRYEIAFAPDYLDKSISGSNEIAYKVVKPNNGSIKMQIDLQEPLVIDSVLYNGKQKLKFAKKESVWLITVPAQKMTAGFIR